MPVPRAFDVVVPRDHDINDLIEGNLNPQTTELMFPEDKPKYYCTLDFERYRFRTGSGYTAGNQFATGFISLPLPVNLVDKQFVRYDEKPIAGDLLQSVYRQIGGALLSPALIYNGVAPNWYQTLMFDRPEYKRYALEFKLAPRNFTEATSIRNIITAVNNFMAPGIQGVGGAAVLFTFPDIVKVMFHPNSKFLYKFKPAVIEQMIVNYNGGGNQKAFYHNPSSGGADGDNPPESVEITLQLIEVEYWLRGQFTNENDPDVRQV